MIDILTTLWILIMPQWAEPQRHTVVVVCVSEFVILQDSCWHFLRDRWKLRTETCNASLIQHYLEMKLVDFGLVALLWSYGVICSPRWQLPAIQSPVKNKFPTTGCLSTWQFNLYNKSKRRLEWNPENETAKATQTKFCLPQHITDHVQLKVWPNLAPTPADCSWLHCCLKVHSGIPAITQNSRPAIMYSMMLLA